MPESSKQAIVYVYDALCPWCYAFTPVVQHVQRHYGDRFAYEVLSGGLVRADQVRTIGGPEEVDKLRNAYRAIEERADVQFGDAFYRAVEQGERTLNSEPPAVALAVFRQLDSGLSEIDFARAVGESLFIEGGNPTEPEFYRGLAHKLNLDPQSFLEQMEKPEFKDRAVYDFALAKQIGADAFPRLYLQTAPDYLHLVSKGYAPFAEIKRIIDAISSDDRSER